MSNDDEPTRSRETLHHFRCGECGGWWAVGGAPESRQQWCCPWCGKEQTFPVLSDTEVQADAEPVEETDETDSSVPQQVFTPPEIAELTGLHEPEVRHLCQTGLLESFGNREKGVPYCVTRSNLIRWWRDRGGRKRLFDD